jgi:hypothetical protein
MTQDALTAIKAFVAGEMSPSDFRDRLYSQPQMFEEFLNHDPNLDPATYVNGSTFRFLLELDFNDPGDQLSAQGALTEYLDRNNIAYTKTEQYADYYNLVLQAQPDWLDVDAKWVQDQLMPQSDGRTGPELQEWLTESLLRHFRYVNEPPEWIQSPSWPINGNRPLVFLGQLDVNNYFHDAASIYIFHDPDTGTCETVIQTF